jgi:hypothetical protein
MRLHAQTAMIENGFVHVPERAPWLAQYLHELTAFPNGKHDDQVDSTAQMLDWFKGAARENGWVGYYRRLSEQARTQPAPPEPLSAIAKRLGLLGW